MPNGFFFSRCEQKQKEKFENSAAFSSALKWSVWEFWDVGPILEKVMKDFEGNGSTLAKGWGRCMNVTGGDKLVEFHFSQWPVFLCQQALSSC